MAKMVLMIWRRTLPDESDDKVTDCKRECLLEVGSFSVVVVCFSCVLC